MTTPHEFTPDAVAAASKDAYPPYRDFIRSKEPMASIISANPWLTSPPPDEPLVWGEGRFYDTTVGRKHEHWRDIALPRATKDIHQLRRDLHEWGYCLIEDALSVEQCTRMRRRLVEQAEAERVAEIAYMAPTFQMVWMLVNKGDCFVQCVEHDPAGVQAGPLIEQLMDETLGRGWYSYSFVATISFPGGRPQPLHQDQASIHPFQTPEAPVLLNTMYILQDVNEVNGGTLVIPASHKVHVEPGCDATLPPAINVEAKAGSVMVFDGRLLHGTAVNHSDEWRYVISQPNVKSWVRQQENWMLGIRPEVLANASPKLLQRMGFQAGPGYGITEGYGAYSTGRPGDPNGALVHIRKAIDEGRYVRVGELTVDDARRLDPDTFTLQRLQGELGENRTASAGAERERVVGASASD